MSSTEWNEPENSSYFADFALQLLDYFFSFQWFNLHSVEFAGRSKLQLHRIFHSLDQTVFSTFAGRHEFLGVNDFSRHVFTTFSAILVTMHVIICFGGRKQTDTGASCPNESVAQMPSRLALWTRKIACSLTLTH
jgi:hypothetical protein